MVRLIAIALLIGLLTACGVSDSPPSTHLVEKTLALSIKQTQQQLSQQLGLDVQGVEINRLLITQQEPLTIQDLPGYNIKGTYDLTLKLPKQQVIQQQNPFEVYLQRQKEGKTWRLAIPESTQKSSSVRWATYILE